jgi:Family of unknown function (DUF6325)
VTSLSEGRVTVPAESTSREDDLGPVDFLVIEFPGARVTSGGFEQLLTLADQGVIDVLDLEFVASDVDGNVRTLELQELGDGDGADLSAWTGASSGLLDDTDLRQIASSLQPGSIAAVVIYENRWIFSVVDAWRREGARLIADGGLSPDELVAALDATEPS